MAKSTSFRLTSVVKSRLAARADREGISATALLERLITEGIDTIEHPGIIYRGPAHDRRSAVAGGPDVWEVIARLRELEGSEEQRIAILAEESRLHSRQIRAALEFAAHHPNEVEARISANEAAIEVGRAAAERRSALLA